MRGLSTELKVGLFAVLVIAILAFMTFKVGGLYWVKEEGNLYYIYFKNVAGLDEKTKIKIAGVDAGILEKIELQKGLAKITVRVKKGVLLNCSISAARALSRSLVVVAKLLEGGSIVLVSSQ